MASDNEESNTEKKVNSVSEEVKKDKPVENLNDEKDEHMETEESKETKNDKDVVDDTKKLDNETKKVGEETKKVDEETKKVDEETKKVEEETKKVDEETKKLEEETKNVDETKEEEKTKEVDENKEKKIDEIKEDEKVDETKKTEKCPEPTDELLKRIRDQIEFYFGNVNMQRDKFLIEQIKLDEGWIPLSVMLNFNMLAKMTTDCDVIIKALEKSELIEISENKNKIRRSTKFPLPKYDEEYRKAQEAKTVYLKGFPMNDTNIQMLKTFLNQYEPYENIVMRKYQDKDKVLRFKGSIFVQFKTLDDAKAFMERETITYNGANLIKKWAADYIVERANEKEGKRLKYQESKNKRNESAQKDVKVLESIKLPKGAIIHLSKMPTVCRRDLIRAVFEKFEVPIAYIHYESGDEEAWIRFQEENSAKTILDKLPNKEVTIDKQKITCRVLENEEEQNYLDEVKKYIVNMRQRSKNRIDSRKGRSSHKGGRKRHATSPPPNQPSIKTTVVE